MTTDKPKMTEEQKKWMAEGDAYTLGAAAEIMSDPARKKAAIAAGKKTAAQTKRSIAEQKKRVGFMENLGKAFGAGTQGKVGTAKKITKKVAAKKAAKKVTKATTPKVTRGKKAQAAKAAQPAKPTRAPRVTTARAKKAAKKK